MRWLIHSEPWQSKEAIPKVAIRMNLRYRVELDPSERQALAEQARPGAQRKLSGKEEALLIATARTNPPPGRARWTLELLADAFIMLTGHEALSRETVRRRLAENDLKPWRRDMRCIPKVDAQYVARMGDVLDLYAETPDPRHPVVCFDESPTQLIGEVRQPIPSVPGRPLRYDCEYKRNGTANLSTHTPAALYRALPAPEARRILQRIEFRYTPKHASWLTMVEIEIGVLRSQCLDRRIDSHTRLIAEVAAWEQLRNASCARINWMFSTETARTKLAKAYPVPTSPKPS